MEHLGRKFQSVFEIVSADTPDLISECQQLRYQVYCLETGFEDPSQFSDQREADKHDLNSVHRLIRHRESGLWAASVRIVLPEPGTSDFRFPIEEHCPEVFSTYKSLLKGVDRQKVGEISRFLVSGEFKHRLGEFYTLSGVQESVESEQNGLDIDEVPTALPMKQSIQAHPQIVKDSRVLPNIPLGLMASIVEASYLEGLTHLYAIMEPRLVRYFKKYGINFDRLGQVVEYHGKRQPCIIDICKAEKELWGKRPEIWRFLTDNGRYSFFEPVIGDKRQAVETDEKNVYTTGAVELKKEAAGY